MIEKTQEHQFVTNDKQLVAKWSDLVELHKFEQQNLIKRSKLVERSVAPSPIERQKLLPCLQVFCDKTVPALKSHPRLSSGDSGTVCVFEAFVKLWK